MVNVVVVNHPWIASACMHEILLEGEEKRGTRKNEGDISKQRRYYSFAMLGYSYTPPLSVFRTLFMPSFHRLLGKPTGQTAG